MARNSGVTRLLTAVLVVFLLFQPTGCAKHHYKKGNKALLVGNTAGAIEQFNVAVKKDPQNATYRLALGNAYLQNSEFKKASNALQRAAELAPDNQQVLENLAFAYRKQGDDDNAITVYWRLFSLHPTMDVYGKLMTLLEQHERFDEAVEATLLLSKQPGFDPGRLNVMAEKYLRLGQQEPATRLIVRSLEMNPSQAEQWRTLGQLQLKKGDAHGAIDSFSKACKLDPTDVAATEGLADALRKIGKLDEARQQYERALNLNPNLKAARVAQVEIYLAQGRLEEAVSFAREAVIRFPDDPKIKALKGAVHLARHEWREAVATLDLALSRSEQQDPKVLAMLGRAYVGLGEKARARRQFDRALALNPDNGEANLGLCQLDLDDHRERQGLDRCQKAMVQSPELRDRAVAIMTAYYEAEDRIRRIAELQASEAAAEQEAVSQKKTTPASSARGRKHQRKKSVQKRLEELEEMRAMLEGIPEEERTARDWYELGEVCIKLDDLETAEKAFTRAWKSDPDNLEYRMRMAEVLLAGDKYDSALVHFREIVRQDDTNVPARISLVQAMLGRGEAEKTTDLLADLRDLDPDNPEVYELSAEACFTLGLTAQAEAYQKTAVEKRAKKAGQDEPTPAP